MAGSDQDLHHLVYLSSARWLPSAGELEDLLVAARGHNRRHGITGLLLYADGAYIQVIEGPRTEVRALFERIRRDVRHDRVTVLVQGPLEQRRFDGWSMGFQLLAGQDLSGEPGFSRFLEADFVLDEFRADSLPDLQLLLKFREIHYRHPGVTPVESLGFTMRDPTSRRGGWRGAVAHHT